MAVIMSIGPPIHNRAFSVFAIALILVVTLLLTIEPVTGQTPSQSQSRSQRRTSPDAVGSQKSSSTEEMIAQPAPASPAPSPIPAVDPVSEMAPAPAAPRKPSTTTSSKAENESPSPSPSQSPSKRRTSIYERQRQVSKNKHQHSDDENKPVGELGSENSVSDTNNEIQAYGSIAAPTVTRTNPVTDTDSDRCLTPEKFAEAKERAKQRLLAVMEQYLSVWQLEDKSDAEIDTLYTAKAAELKSKLKAKKLELQKLMCANGSESVGRQLLSASDDDDEEWLERASVASNSIIAGDEIESISDHVVETDDSPIAHSDDEGDSEGDSDEEMGLAAASIHPFNPIHDAPSAFSDLTERDIESRHAIINLPTHVIAATPMPEDDETEMGFLASITPSRYLPALQSQSPSVIVSAARSQRDLDEEIEDEKRRRRERLKARRGIVVASILPNSYAGTITEGDKNTDSKRASNGDSDDGSEPSVVGHFVASIKPMAPQRSSPVFEEDQMLRDYGSNIGQGSITAPSVARSVISIIRHSDSEDGSSKPLQREWLKNDGRPSSSSSLNRLNRLVRGAADQ